jgi:hypothetical protein
MRQIEHEHRENGWLKRRRDATGVSVNGQGPRNRVR